MLTSDYPHFKFEFDTFNPVQDSCFPYYDKDCNLVVASSVASGKTCIASMIIGHHLASNSTSKVFYSSPLCAISSQMEEDWRKISLFNSNMSPKGTYDKKYRLFISTVEGLDVMARKRDPILSEACCFVFDEAHLISDETRGSDAESLIMSVTDINPSARIIFLSGTLGNSKEMASWLKSLNGKPTYSIKSDWRPCALEKEVKVNKSYRDLETQIYQMCIDNLYDKILIFVHSKVQGRNLVKYLLNEGINCGFFSADISEYKGKQMLARFKDQGSGFDVLVATSALGMGVNL